MLCIALNPVSRIGSKDAVGCYLLSLEGHQLQSSLSIHESLALLSPIEGKNMPRGARFLLVGAIAGSNSNGWYGMTYCR